MKAEVTDRGDVLLTPENNAERFVLEGWVKNGNTEFFAKNFGWTTGSLGSYFSSILIGPWPERKARLRKEWATHVFADDEGTP